MSAKEHSHDNSKLEPLLNRLRQLPDGGLKMLDLAAALSNRGYHTAAAHAESAALDLCDPQVTHRWRQIQAQRAPANQFLLLRNELRTTAFRNALAARIKPGDLVLEIGTGSGILAMMAAKAGASQIVTCEHQALMANVSKSIVRDNRMEDKITVLAKKSSQLEIGRDLPRQADVLVADLFTGALLEAGGLSLIHQARKALTRSNGHVIPAAASLRGRLVGGADLESLCRANLLDGLDLSRFNLFSPPVVQILPERFVTLQYQACSEIIECFDFDFNTLAGFEPRQRSLEVKSTGEGTALGLLQWIRLELSPGNSLESDENSEIAWSRYLHVFPQPIALKAGQAINLHLEHDRNSFSVWPELET